MCAGGQQREQPGEEERREFGRVDVGGDLPGVLGPADDAHQELSERVLRQLVFDRPRRGEVQSEHVPENRWAQTFFRAEHVLHELVEHRHQIAGGPSRKTATAHRTGETSAARSRNKRNGQSSGRS